MALPEIVLTAGAKSFAGALTKLAADHAARTIGNTIKQAERVKTDITPHVEATYQRCSTIKTLLNPHQPANFLSIYATQRFSLNRREFDQYSLVDYIRSEENNVIVTGTGGTGKSMFMRYLWLSLFVHSDGKLPLFVELRSLNTISQNDLVQYIFHSLTSGQSNINQKDFHKKLVNGDFVILLDGFDELAEERRDAVQSSIISLGENYPKLKIVLSSRPDRDRFSSWQSFHVVAICPLTKPDLIQLIERSEFDPTPKKLFLKKIKEGGLYETHKSFLSNPLLASMMLLTFSHNFDIPDTTHLFYEQAFDALFQRHDSHKPGGYQREFKTNLSEFEFKRLLSYTCLLSYYESKYEFSRDEILSFITRASSFEKLNIDPSDFLHDLEKCVCMLVLDGLIYTFPHRSFQEYFSAYCLAYVTQNRFSDIVSALGKRQTDLAIRLLSEMNPEAFRDKYVLPTAEKWNDVLQLNMKSKNPIRYLSDTKGHFAYHITDTGSDGFFITLNINHPAHDYLMLIARLNQTSNKSNGSDAKDLDAQALTRFKEILRRKNVQQILISGTETGLKFEIKGPRSSTEAHQNLNALTEAFKASGMHRWLSAGLRATANMVERERSIRSSSVGAMDELLAGGA